MELNFLFWNTNGKKCLSEIGNLVTHYQTDILILSENTALPAEILAQLNRNANSFYPPHPRSNCSKIKIYTKFHYDYIEPITESNRITARTLTLPTLDQINIVGLHLGDKGSFSAESQSEACSESKIFIDSFEYSQSNYRTVIVGDFNMNPFELGLIKANGFHATMSKKIARQVSRRVQNKDYQYFYNPMWSLFGDINGDIAGTYYYRRAELINYQWNIFDQVLVRPALVDSFDHTYFKIVTSDGIKNLITKDGLPNKQHYSDHLPIIFKLKL